MGVSDLRKRVFFIPELGLETEPQVRAFQESGRPDAELGRQWSSPPMKQVVYEKEAIGRRAEAAGIRSFSTAQVCHESLH